MPSFRIRSKLGLYDSTWGKDSLGSSMLRQQNGQPRRVMTMLQVARDSGMFDRAWLRACNQTLVWQSAGASFYRLSQDDGEWDALFLPRSREPVRSPRPTCACAAMQMPRSGSIPRRHSEEEDDHRVLVFDTQASCLDCCHLRPFRCRSSCHGRSPWFGRLLQPMLMAHRSALYIRSILPSIKRVSVCERCPPRPPPRHSA